MELSEEINRCCELELYVELDALLLKYNLTEESISNDIYKNDYKSYKREKENYSMMYEGIDRLKNELNKMQNELREMLSELLSKNE